MAFDWTTFVLEIINFLVLVWILKRFLYQPVLDTIAKRREGINQTLRTAEEKEQQANALKMQFESRLAEWEKEKNTARTHLSSELAAERQRQLDALNKEIELERERSAAQESHRTESLKRELTTQCNQQARQFASRLLTQLAGPELEARLIDFFIEEIKALPEEQIHPIQTGLAGKGVGTVSTAFVLTEEQRQQISKTLDDHFEIRSQLTFTQDPSLVAGLRLSLGAWQMDMSLAGELGVYAEASGFGH